MDHGKSLHGALRIERSPLGAACQDRASITVYSSGSNKYNTTQQQTECCITAASGKGKAVVQGRGVQGQGGVEGVRG